jgi:hypothetical protein
MGWLPSLCGWEIIVGKEVRHQEIVPLEIQASDSGTGYVGKRKGLTSVAHKGIESLLEREQRGLRDNTKGVGIVGTQEYTFLWRPCLMKPRLLEDTGSCLINRQLDLYSVTHLFHLSLFPICHQL